MPKRSRTVSPKTSRKTVKSAKSTAAKASPSTTVPRGPRKLKPAPPRKFLFWKRPKTIPRPARLPSAWRLTKTSLGTLWRHKEVFLIVALIYGLLNLVLVRGLASATDITELKGELNSVFTGNLGAVASGLSVFVVLLGSSGNGSSDTAGAYQLFITLMASLALIWALRQVLAGAAIRARDAYYRGMYPLVPFILVLVVCGLQTVPFAIGTSLYSLVITNGIAVHAIEKLLWGILAAGLAAISIYMLCSSVFALYIVALPNMTPLKALRSARQIVRYRRWMILRKLLWLPFMLLIIAAVIMLPIIIFVTPLAQWIFFILTMIALAVIHSYMYSLYRELLHE